MKFSYKHKHNQHPTKPAGGCIPWKQSNFALCSTVSPVLLSAPLHMSHENTNVHLMHAQLFAPASSTGAIAFHVSVFLWQMQPVFAKWELHAPSWAEQRLHQVRLLNLEQIFAIKHKKGKMCLPLLSFDPSQFLILPIHCRSSFWVSPQSLIYDMQSYKTTSQLFYSRGARATFDHQDFWPLQSVHTIFRQVICTV